MSDLSEEIFDVVDADDNVIGQAPRAEVHARGLLHRAANVFVFNTRGQLLVQKRAASKDEYPLCYTSSASGHLSAGETYDVCAAREMEEEIGLTAPLELLHKFPGHSQNANEHTVLYQTVSDEELTLDSEEIESARFWDLDELIAQMKEHPERFTPPFRELLGWYLKQRGRGSGVGDKESGFQ